MSSTLLFACDDLARLVRHGLGERVRGVECAVAEGELRFVLTGVDASRWLPRLRLEIAVAPRLRTATQEVEARWRVVPSSLTGILAKPAQHLGVGAKVVDALIAHLGWEGAVAARDNALVVLALGRVAQMQRLHLCMQDIAVDAGLRLDLSIAEPCAPPQA